MRVMVQMYLKPDNPRNLYSIVQDAKMDIVPTLPLLDRPCLVIIEQPDKFQKFIYRSQSNDSTSLRCKFMLSTQPLREVYILCDAYTEDNKLSSHFLVPRSFDPDNFPPIHILQIPSSDANSLTGVLLENVHIFRRPRKKLELSLTAKLQFKRLWKTRREILTDDEKEKLRGSVPFDPSGSNQSFGKVYIGFTAYTYNNNSNRMERYTDTYFSASIYDSDNINVLEPYNGYVEGGSEHILVIRERCIHDNRFDIEFQGDCGWRAFATEVRVDGSRISFKIPPYNGYWRDGDDSVLVHIQLHCCKTCKARKRFKFLYEQSKEYSHLLN
ncbi:uncharacterized protein LOC131801163 isoform X2 [Musca domestica]|uniref:Uncharacterized protein LOC131801163 isoform X2 n=1 Tax=Musca domestica TaxID=7370 RepID=A0ABM3UP51_MUSDO|nr:uncharacterized protein LOC131801163 isoform X2 [Musca domestica]